MPKGVPKNGFRKSKNWKKQNGIPVTETAAKLPVSTTRVVPENIDTGETDEQISKRLRTKFHVMDKMTASIALGASKSMIISGPPGLGKSYGVEQVLSAYVQEKTTPTHTPKVSIIKGMVRATGLYKLFYRHKDPGSIVCFDDADGIFYDDDAISLLKVACDTTERRVLHWLAETNMKDDSGNDIETSFEFKGTVIFITNTDFQREIDRNSRLSPHFEALVSRSHYLDLGMKTRRDYLIRIKQVIEDGMLNERGLSTLQQQMVIMYIERNFEKLWEVSLRMAIKIAEIMKMGENWQLFANETCLINRK